MSVFSKKQILERIERDRRIFLDGTYVEANFWAAKYDLRIATDYMIIPDSASPRGQTYPRGTHRTKTVIINPGQVAFFSTAERFCMPWDILGSVGPKFSLTRQGLLVLTGSVVDPGFGLQKKGDTWFPKEDERLHFLVANLGNDPVALKPGLDAIASIYFLAVSGAEPGARDIESTRDVHLEFFESPGVLGLGFFNVLTQMRIENEEEHRRLEGAVGAIQHGSTQIIFFGVFLLAVSLLGVAAAFVLGLLGNDEVSALGDDIAWPAATVVASISAVVVAICVVVITWLALRRRRT